MEPRATRLPPLFDPAFLDVLAGLPPPRLVPGVLRTVFARRALEPLQPHLKQDLARYSENLRTWAVGALSEMQPREDELAVPAPRNEELSALEGLVDQVGGA